MFPYRQQSLRQSVDPLNKRSRQNPLRNDSTDSHEFLYEHLQFKQDDFNGFSDAVTFCPIKTVSQYLLPTKTLVRAVV